MHVQILAMKISIFYERLIQTKFKISHKRFFCYHILIRLDNKKVCLDKKSEEFIYRSLFIQIEIALNQWQYFFCLTVVVLFLHTLDITLNSKKFRN